MGQWQEGGRGKEIAAAIRFFTIDAGNRHVFGCMTYVHKRGRYQLSEVFLREYARPYNNNTYNIGHARIKIRFSGVTRFSVAATTGNLDVPEYFWSMLTGRGRVR